MSVKIFVMTHKPFTPPADPMYLPLHVGRYGAKDLGFLGDDTNDSISSLNPYFCELTGMYWIWKNYRKADYIGICHYRRYLINEKGSIFTEAQLEKLLMDYDIITTKLLTLTCSYYHGFGENHHIKDLEITGEVIKEKYPKYTKSFETLVHGPHTYFGNIFVTSKEQYHNYCTWLFDILFEVQKRTDFTGYNDYQKRLFGFLSEFLQTVWISYHKLRVYECKVGMVGEKYETNQLKKRLADYFADRDYEGAKEYFLSCYQKRPDVLMEASDVTGELRLCMQIISTCSFEKEYYHCCILDTINDYDSLIQHFHRLNSTVLHFLTDNPHEEDLQFLRQTPSVTPASVEIALRMYCKNTEKQKKIFQKISSLLSGHIS